MQEPLCPRTRIRVAIWSLVVGGLLLLRFSLGFNHQLTCEGFESMNVARSLAEGRGWADPYSTGATGPTTHMAPMYPLWVAGWMKIWGFGPEFTLFMQWLNALLVAGLAASLPWVSLACGGGVAPGVAAGAIAALLPFWAHPLWEASLTGALVCLLTVLAVRGMVWATGITAAFLILLQPSALPVFAGMVALDLWKHRRWDRALRLALAPALFLTLWTARNYHEFGRFIPVRGNMGMELDVAFNDCAQPALATTLNSGCYDQHHPNMNARETARIAVVGESRYFAEKQQTAMRWIVAHPRRAALLVFQRMQLFWLRRDPQGEVDLGWVPWVTLLGWLGLVVAWQSNRHLTAIAALWMLLYPLPYYLAVNSDRFRYPIYWLSYLLAGWALVGAVRWIDAVRNSARPPIAAGRPRASTLPEGSAG